MAPSRRAGRGLQLRGVIIAAALVLVSVGVIGAVALSQGGWPFAEPATLPQEGALDTGRYTTDEFEPSFSLSLDEGWAVGIGDMTDVFSIGLEGQPGQLDFSRPEAVFDPEDPKEGGILLPTPNSTDEWVAWYREHPFLDAEEPVPVTVGGVSGVRIDSVVSSVPEGNSILPLWTYSGRILIGDEKGTQYRTIILEVEGETLLVGLSAPSNDTFEQLLPKAEGALDTVEWGGG
jgi:hypothetical protein